MNIKNLPIGENFPEEVNVVVEIPKMSRNKYEYDEELDVIRLDRTMHSPLFYPADYGFIPATRADDGDHLDVLVLTGSPSFPGCVLTARPVGVLEMEDDKGVDYKVLALPCGNPRYEDMKQLSDIREHTKKEIVHFFEEYKHLEEKSVKIGNWLDREKAYEIIRESKENFDKE